MHRLALGMFLFGALAGSAEAGIVCATPSEMKVLQSAALQQQLMVAALSCRMTADYNAFVTAYRSELLTSDRALKAFFAGKPRGEDYNAYKTRIANVVSLRSLHDAKFCESAQKVFDMALGRGGERRGLAPEPPQLIDTGYEGCRPVDDKVIEARVVAKPQPRPARVAKAAPKPAHVALQIAKPAAPAARPVVSPAAEQALRLAKPRASEPEVAAAVPKSAPTTRVQVAALAPDKPVPVPLARRVPPPPTMPPAASSASDDPADAPPDTPAERPQWHPPMAAAPSQAPDDDDAMLMANDNVPNAYRPGSYWVSDARPAARPAPRPVWRPVAYGPPPPYWGRLPRGAYFVRGPDGRWIMMIPSRPYWVRD